MTNVLNADEGRSHEGLTDLEAPICDLAAMAGLAVFFATNESDSLDAEIVVFAFSQLARMAEDLRKQFYAAAHFKKEEART
jgi:hypothetical protein